MMKLKLKCIILLLPTLLVGSLLTVACTDNDKTTSNTLKSNTTDQKSSDTNDATNNNDGSPTPDSNNNVDDTNGNSSDSDSIQSMNSKGSASASSTMMPKGSHSKATSNKDSTGVNGHTGSVTRTDNQESEMPSPSDDQQSPKVDVDTHSGADNMHKGNNQTIQESGMKDGEGSVTEPSSDADGGTKDNTEAPPAGPSQQGAASQDQGTEHRESA